MRLQDLKEAAKLETVCRLGLTVRLDSAQAVLVAEALKLARRVVDLFVDEKTGVRSSAKLAKILGEDVETAAALYRYLLGDT